MNYLDYDIGSYSHQYLRKEIERISLIFLVI